MVIKTAEGWIKYMSGEYKDVITLLDKAITNDSNFPWSYYVLAQAYEEIGDYDLAEKNYKYACDVGNESPFYLAGLGHIQGISQEDDKALVTLNRLKALKETSFISSLDLALAGISVLEESETLDLIRTGIEERVSLIQYLFVDPRFNKYVNDDLINIIESRKI